MLKHIVRHIFRTARPTDFKLGTRMEDDEPPHSQAHDLQGHRGQDRKVTWYVCAVLSQWCDISGWRGYTVSAEPGGHTSCSELSYTTKQQIALKSELKQAAEY